MGRARQIAGNENQDRILLDASAASTDEGEHLLLDASAATTDVGFFINTEIGTTEAAPEVQENIILNKVATHAVASKRQIFESSGTFTVPTGVTKLYVSICAGGGAGQNQGSNQSGGGGAGALFVPVFVYPGAAISVTLGAASSGTFSGGAHGADGNDSSFGASGEQWYINCDGGKGSSTQKGGLYEDSENPANFQHSVSPFSGGGPISGGGDPTQFGSGGSVFGQGNARGVNHAAKAGFGVGGAGGDSGHNGQGGGPGFCVVEW